VITVVARFKKRYNAYMMEKLVDFTDPTSWSAQGGLLPGQSWAIVAKRRKENEPIYISTYDAESISEAAR
jgi:hypothetical protein